jgi:hypothetical protein
MKPQWSPACAEAIGVPWLREALAPSGALGRRARERERTFRPGDEGAARAALTRVERVAQAHDLARLAALRATIGAAPDVGPLLARARAGGVLGEVDFFELGRFLDALAGIRALGPQAAGGADELPAVTLLHDQLAPGTSKARTFYLDDAFDPLLAAARGEAAACQAAYDAARSRLAERVARYAGLDAIPQREFVVMRDRMSGPLPPEIHVLRELPAYVLCEISLDAAALSALSARDAAAARVAELEERVRARLSAQVALEAEALERSCDALGEFDLVLARAQFAQRYGCTVPEVVESRTLAFHGGPLLAARARARAARPPLRSNLARLGGHRCRNRPQHGRQDGRPAHARLSRSLRRPRCTGPRRRGALAAVRRDRLARHRDRSRRRRLAFVVRLRGRGRAHVSRAAARAAARADR